MFKLFGPMSPAKLFWIFLGCSTVCVFLVLLMTYQPEQEQGQTQAEVLPADDEATVQTCVVPVTGRFGYTDSGSGEFIVTSQETTTLVYEWSVVASMYIANEVSWHGILDWQKDLVSSQIERVKTVSGLSVSYTEYDWFVRKLSACPAESKVSRLVLGSEWTVVGNTATYSHQGIWMQVHANDLHALLGSELVLPPVSSVTVNWAEAASLWDGAVATFTFTAKLRQDNPGAVQQAQKAMAFASWASLNKGVATTFYLSHSNEDEWPVEGWLVPSP